MLKDYTYLKIQYILACVDHSLWQPFDLIVRISHFHKRHKHPDLTLQHLAPLRGLQLPINKIPHDPIQPTNIHFHNITLLEPITLLSPIRILAPIVAFITDSIA